MISLRSSWRRRLHFIDPERRRAARERGRGVGIRRVLASGVVISVSCIGLSILVPSATAQNPEPSWSVSTTTPEPGGLSSIACPSTSDCIAVGTIGPMDKSGTVLVTDDGGSSWLSENVNAQATSLDDVSCPSTSDCFAVGVNALDITSPFGVVMASSDGGLSWTTQTLPAGITSLTGISCTSTTVCVCRRLQRDLKHG